MRKRRIKFALELKDGEEVRSMDELRAYFDLEKIIGYYQDGRLYAWLEDRFCNTEAEEIRKLTGSEANLGEQLCRIFHVEQTTNIKEYTDVDDIARRKARLDSLKQYTDDPAILEHVDWTARNQEDLEKLLKSNHLPDTIYLCGNTFRFSLDMLERRNIHYVGMGKNVVISIESQEPIIFEALGISFDNIRFDEAYEKLQEKLPAKWFKHAQEMECNGETEEALKWYLKAAKANNLDAMFALGMMFVKSANSKIVELKNESGKDNRSISELKNKIINCYDTAIYWYHNLAKIGMNASSPFSDSAALASKSMIEMGKIYESGILDKFENENWKAAIKWYAAASRLGNCDALKPIYRLALSEFIFKLNLRLPVKKSEGLIYPKRYINISFNEHKSWNESLDSCYPRDEIFHIHEECFSSDYWLIFKEETMMIRWKQVMTDWFPYNNINTVRYNPSELIIEAQIQRYKKICICNMDGWSARAIAIFLAIAAKKSNALTADDISVVKDIQLDSLQGKSILSLLDTERTTRIEKDEPFWFDDIIGEYSRY